jgi:hypothetical protein
MPTLPIGSTLLVILALALFLLILIAVAPQSVATVLGQLIQLVGRLAGALAEEAEAGATTLFNIVKGVFAAGGRPAKTPEKPPPQAQGQPGQATQRLQPPAAGASAGTDTTAAQAPGGAQPAQGQPGQAAQPQGSAAQGSTADDISLLWIPETIFVRLLYLVTVAIIAGADFVFAILRLQAVLFPSLPIPVNNLPFLSELTGALFVSIILLTGALTLDFLNVLPPPARLFPHLDDRRRRLLLTISLLSLVLSILVVAALFLVGQVLTSFAQNFPLGAVAIATLLGVLQVLVVFLGAWGAIRGLAILLALAGGLVGIVLHLVALVVRWIAEALYEIGMSILPSLIFGIAAIFGHRRDQPHRSSPDNHELSLVGYGDRSSLFTALLCEDVVRMYGEAGLLGAGVYAEEQSVRDDVRARLARLGVNNISPTSNNDTTPLITLKGQLIRALQSKGTANKILLWIVDGEKAAQCVGTLASLKSDLPSLSIAVLCFMPRAGARDMEPYRQLKRLATQKLAKGEPAVSTIIVSDPHAPLYRALGEPNADRLLARGLSGMLLAPLHDPTNPSFATVTRSLNEAGFPFAALAADSAGLVAARSTDGKSSQRPPTGRGSVATELTLARAEDLTREVLSGADTTTVGQRLDSKQPSLYVNFIVPLSARSPGFSQFRGAISNWLAEEYEIYLYSVVEGEGIDLSESRPNAKGDRYSQVGVLYGMRDVEALPAR